MALGSYVNRARFELAKRLSDDKRYSLDTFLVLAGMRDWKATDTIFDVGANDGRTVIRWRRHMPATHVYAFEPVESTFRTLVEKTGPLGNVQHFQLALGASPGRHAIYLHEGGSPMNSFYADRANSERSEEVEVDTLDAVVDREGVQSIQLLKIDAEGHDLEVLKGATNALRDRKIEIIQVEAGFDVPKKTDAKLWEFSEFLRPYGYYLHAITNLCRGTIPGATDRNGPKATMLSYCDALFIRA